MPVVLKSQEIPFCPEVDSELIFILKLSAANTNISVPCPKAEQRMQRTLTFSMEVQTELPNFYFALLTGFKGLKTF